MEAGVVGKPSFTTLQSAVALIAGLTSIVGAAYSAVGTFRPVPRSGEIVAVVRDAATAEPLPDAVVEVLAPDDTLVTTLGHADSGAARGKLPPGAYRVHVAHPDFVDVVRDVRVVPDGAAELQIGLAHRPRRAASARASSSGHTEPVAATPGAAIDRGIAAGRRLLGRIGF